MKIKKQKPQVNLFVEQIAKATKKYSKENGIGNVVAESHDEEIIIDEKDMYVVLHSYMGGEEFVTDDGSTVSINNPEKAEYSSIDEIKSKVKTDENGTQWFGDWPVDELEIGQVTVRSSYRIAGWF